MNLIPRLRQACRGDRQAVSALSGHLDPGREVNRTVLSGMIVADPQRDRSREGEPVTVLLLSFAAPDDRAHGGSACCEVEVPDELAEPRRRDLRAGAPVLISGQMTGAGGIWADYIVTGRAEVGLRREKRQGGPGSER